MNFCTKTSAICLLLLFTIFCSIGVAAPAATSFHRTGQVDYSAIEGGFYGIIGDDGVKYQPRNLPHKFKKHGLVLKFDATINDNVFSTVQWGTIVDLTNVSEVTSVITADERRAIYVLLQRMDAFNTKNLVKLQQIDTLAKKLTPEHFDNWVSKYTHYTLRYVDISSADPFTITGACYYTREAVDNNSLSSPIELASMTFTINKGGTGWKLTESATLPPSSSDDTIDVLAKLKQKAMEKYHTDDLATLWQ